MHNRLPGIIDLQANFSAKLANQALNVGLNLCSAKKVAKGTIVRI
jgi:hypothetical protein